jgi:hypothetical protein
VGELALKNNAGLVSARALNALNDAQRIRAEHNPRLSSSFGFVESVSRDTCSFELSHNVGLEAEGLALTARPTTNRLLGML